MLPRTILSAVLVVVAAPAALAQPAGDVATETTDAAIDAPAEPSPVLGYGAMPGGLLTAAATGLPAGQVGAVSLAAFGFRDDLLADGHRYIRGSGSLAVAYAPIPLLTVGLTIDGRYDRHSGSPADGEDGYVGDPRLLLRLARPVGAITLGAQLGVWLPGKDAPSVAFSATTRRPARPRRRRPRPRHPLGQRRLPPRPQLRVDRRPRRAEPGRSGVARRQRVQRGARLGDDLDAVGPGLRLPRGGHRLLPRRRRSRSDLARLVLPPASASRRAPRCWPTPRSPRWPAPRWRTRCRSSSTIRC